MDIDIVDLADVLHNNNPINLRVFGFGEKTREIIDCLCRLNYDTVSSKVIDTDAEIPVPTESDYLAIIIVSEYSPTAVDVAKAFHNAQIRTLVILYPDVAFDSIAYDSVTTATQAETFDIVRTILYGIINPGLTNYSVDDILTPLNYSRHFKVFISQACGETRMQLACDKIAREIYKLKGIEIMSIFIFYNQRSSNLINMEEISVLETFLRTFPENVDLIWSLYNDDSICDESIRLAFITAGKNIRPIGD